VLEFSVIITDNMGLDEAKIEFWIDLQQINVTLIDGAFFHAWDTTTYSTRTEVEFVVVAYDLQGNRVSAKIYVFADNSLDPFWTYLFAVLGVAALVSLLVTNKYLERKRLKAGITRVGWRDRREQAKFEREIFESRTRQVLSSVDPVTEAARDWFLTCAACKKWFKSQKFDIWCPSCGRDEIYIAKYCPICDRWETFDDVGRHECERCHTVLPKNWEEVREEALARSQNREEPEEVDEQ
jgi:hypothetical protein